MEVIEKAAPDISDTFLIRSRGGGGMIFARIAHYAPGRTPGSDRSSHPKTAQYQTHARGRGATPKTGRPSGLSGVHHAIRRAVHAEPRGRAGTDPMPHRG